MFVYKTNQIIGPKYIINFPTKKHWKNESKIEDIEAGLKDLLKIIEVNSIKSIAIPPLGSGLGGLNWNIVKQKIEEAFKGSEIKVIIYEPLEIKSKTKTKTQEIPKMTPGRAALIELANQYLKGLLSPTISLLEIHKLLYFMQEAGEPLRLIFKKHIYGPYSENLRHVLNAIEGHFILGYEDGGDSPQKQIKLTPKAIEDASIFLKKHESTQNNFNKVNKLVDGFETPYGLELLSTVHWVVKNENVSDFDAVTEKIYSWNKRKQQFTKRQIKIALDVLKKQNWIS